MRLRDRRTVAGDMGERLLVAYLALALAACNAPSASSSSPAPRAQERLPSSRTRRPLAIGESNIARADYIGPEACGDCHDPQYTAWRTSLHRVMNARPADPGAVIGDFAGAVLRYAGGEVHFDRDAAGYTMTTRKGERRTRYRITRTIGHRGLQEYVGVQEREPAAGAGHAVAAGGAAATRPAAGAGHAVAAGAPATREQHGEEVRLPFGWWPRHGGWAAQPDFDPWLDEDRFDGYAPVREPWAERCPWCHSTYPFAQRVARSSGRAVGHGLEQFFTSAPGSDTLAVGEQVTTGISCESCHLGGRAHADGAPIDFLPHGVAPTADAPTLPATFAEQREDPRVVNRVCAQCHSGPSPRLADGTALRNSSEALDLAASACRARCTDCHDPHRGSVDETVAVAACVRCHATQAQPVHAGKGHAGTTCLDCHMPRIVMGIDHYVRTHRISSPTNPTLYAEAAPNACNLCHLDRTIAWTLAELRAGWDVKLRIRTAAYGDDNVGDVWLASRLPAIRLIAMHAFARSPLARFARARIERALHDPEAYVRAWAAFALDEIKRGR